MNTSLFRIAATSALAAACLSACGGGGGGSSPSLAAQTVTSPSTTPTTTPSTPTTTPTTPTTTPDTTPSTPGVQFGTATVSIAGDPGCGYDNVNLTITKLRFHMDAAAVEGSAGWTELPLTTPRRVNTAQLRNGATLSLGTAALLPGHYAQARLVIDANSSGNTTNSVTLAGSSTELPLITQTPTTLGVLYNDSFDVSNGKSTDLVVNVDSCRSILPNNGQVLLRPVLTPVPAVKNGISGFVDKALTGANVRVTAQQSGVIVRASLVDPVTGQFDLLRLPAGKFDVVVTADNAAAAVVAGVAVAAEGTVSLNSAANPIALNASATGTIRSSLSLIPVSTVEAPLANAMQSFANGTLFTSGVRMSNLADGVARLTGLPLGQPSLAVWQAGQPLVWTSNSAINPGLGMYIIVGSAPGYPTTLPQPFTATN